MGLRPVIDRIAEDDAIIIGNSSKFRLYNNVFDHNCKLIIDFQVSFFQP